MLTAPEGGTVQVPPWPDIISTEVELDEVLTQPSPALLEFMPSLTSPLLVLGAGGKMGPTLAVLAKRAAAAAGHPLEVVAASRFSDPASRAWLEARGVRTVSCDLLEPAGVARLPDSANVVYLAGLKFGTTQNPSATWALNTLAPARVCERFPKSRLVALSTGNVYPLAEVARGGSRETDPLTPLGEYANAAVARERLFEFFSRRARTPVALLRLYYAVELRYGVLVDVALKVFRGEPVGLANGHLTCIWQRDANEMILRSFSLAASPPTAWNLCRPEIFRVRDLAQEFGRLLGRAPIFDGTESATAVAGDSAALCARLGVPVTPPERMIRWIAHWVRRGGRRLDKPTHFEVRDGRY